VPYPSIKRKSHAIWHLWIIAISLLEFSQFALVRRQLS
jgi:hypothetical protein